MGTEQQEHIVSLTNVLTFQDSFISRMCCMTWFRIEQNRICFYYPALGEIALFQQQTLKN